MRMSARAPYTKRLELCLSFALSGFMHAVGESMACQKLSFGAFMFFALQPAAILAETFLQQNAQFAFPPRLAGVASALWTMLWFSFTLPLWTDSLRGCGFMTAPSNIPRGMARALLE